jgi:hypothetical protein
MKTYLNYLKYLNAKTRTSGRFNLIRHYHKCVLEPQFVGMLRIFANFSSNILSTFAKNISIHFVSHSVHNLLCSANLTIIRKEGT